ncbi:MAG TPA: hypothetical protein VGQ34_07160 [Sphingomicrobium sp.]|nr:hypothetical protein [Sphingomicrobium sp.]
MSGLPHWDLARWLVEAAGWGGAVLILLAYLLLSAGRLTGQSLAYQAMNVIGAAGFVVNGWWHQALPSAFLNILWLMIGLFASILIMKRHRREAE